MYALDKGANKKKTYKNKIEIELSLLANKNNNKKRQKKKKQVECQSKNNFLTTSNFSKAINFLYAENGKNNKRVEWKKGAIFVFFFFADQKKN